MACAALGPMPDSGSETGPEYCSFLLYPSGSEMRFLSFLETDEGNNLRDTARRCGCQFELAVVNFCSRRAQ